MSNDWGYDDVPDQQGKIVLITGSNQGLGFALANDFLSKTRCEKLIMACRSEEKANTAIEQLGKDPRIEFLQLDLADMGSVRAAAAKLKERVERIDTLVLNAGLMNSGKIRETTKDGFETTFGVCHLGHFLFTAEVWPLVVQSKEARVVSVASVAHEWAKTRGGIDMEDLNWETRRYDNMEAYSQAKIANVFFAKELTRRCKAAGLSTVSVVSNSPGFGDSGLYRDAPWWMKPLIRLGAQSNEKLSVNSMRAATDKTLTNGEYLTPKKMQFYGPPIIKDPLPAALSEETAAALWLKTEEMCGQKFDVRSA